MERFYRAHFINCLSGYKTAILIGTVNQQGAENLAVFSNVFHLGADPALIGFINRPREAAPHSLANIESTGVYTMNHVHQDIVIQAHQTSAKYAAGESEFVATGLTPVYRNSITAPFVAESRLQWAMKLVEVVPIRHNNTYLVIGAVTDVFLPEGLVHEDGFIPVHKAGSMAAVGIDAYYKAEYLNRYSYAKPGKAPAVIDSDPAQNFSQ